MSRGRTSERASELETLRYMRSEREREREDGWERRRVGIKVVGLTSDEVAARRPSCVVTTRPSPRHSLPTNCTTRLPKRRHLDLPPPSLCLFLLQASLFHCCSGPRGVVKHLDSFACAEGKCARALSHVYACMREFFS